MIMHTRFSERIFNQSRYTGYFFFFAVGRAAEDNAPQDQRRPRHVAADSYGTEARGQPGGASPCLHGGEVLNCSMEKSIRVFLYSGRYNLFILDITFATFLR